MPIKSGLNRRRFVISNPPRLVLQISGPMAVEERMKLIIAQIVAILLEKWETYAGLKEQQYPSVAALMIKLREFWSKHGEDVLIISIAPIAVFILFLFAAYLITRF
jgi:hypothetical protein